MLILTTWFFRFLGVNKSTPQLRGKQWNISSESINLGHFNLQMENNCIVFDAVLQNILVCVQEHYSEMLPQTEQRLSELWSRWKKKDEQSFHMHFQSSI